MARTYKRDALGRFAGGGGGGGRPKARSVARGANRLTRDNAGRITSVGGDGATARGDRLRTAGGKQRAVQTARVKGGGANTIAKGGNGISGRVARSLSAVKRARAKPPAPKPPAKTSRPDLGQAAFERRARITEKRARSAERAVAQVDRYNPVNRRLVNRSNSLRSAADSYAYYARRGKTDPDFSAGYLFQKRRRSTTAPKLTRSEKAAATRRANADKRFRENVRRMEAARR